MIDVIKTIISDFLEREKLTKLEYGTVESIDPLKIRIDQKKVLEADDLILSHLVRDYYVDMSVQHSTDSIYGAWDTNHDHFGATTKAPIPIDHEHEYVGRKKIKLHFALKVNEKVVLIREHGGQKYYVLDRIYDPPVEGEWI